MEGQESRCRDYAAARGYVVEAVFPDDVSGGGDFMKRPGLVALLDYIDSHKDVDFVIIFDDLKRFARDTEFHIKLRRTFKSRNVTLECLNFKFEDTPEGEFMETVFAAHGELEREQNRRQVIQKMRERLKGGYWPFFPPVGYKYKAVPPHGKLLVRKEPLASIVQEALEGFATGRFSTQGEVRRFLQEQPAYPKQKGNWVHPQRVTDLLKRPIYAGHIEYEPWGVTMRKGHHAPLISLETHQKIQGLRSGRTTIPNRRDINKDFVLRGAVLCAECGVPYKSCWSKGRYQKYAYYVCQTRTCPSRGKSVARNKVEGFFEQVLQQLTTSQSLYTVAAHMFRDIWDLRAANAKHTRATLENQIRAITMQSDKLLDRILETEDAKMITRYEKKLGQLDIQKALLQEKLEKGGGRHGPTRRCSNSRFGFWQTLGKFGKKATLTCAAPC